MHTLGVVYTQLQLFISKAILKVKGQAHPQ